MDFEEIDFEVIRPLCSIKPIEEYKNVYKSVFESFDRFCERKKLNTNIIYMRRFANLKNYELLDIQNTIQDIYHLKRNNYISDLHEEEIEEIKYYKKLFEDIYKDFQELGI